MDSIYVFRQIPTPIKRLIIYFTGLGTPTSGLIKEEYNKLYQSNQDVIIDQSIGFLGYKCMINKFFNRTVFSELYTRYKNDTEDEFLLPQHVYEIDYAKIYYYDNYSNEYNNSNERYKFCLVLTITSDNRSLYKLFRYRTLKMISEEL
jgi:hypothetical protein